MISKIRASHRLLMQGLFFLTLNKQKIQVKDDLVINPLAVLLVAPKYFMKPGVRQAGKHDQSLSTILFGRTGPRFRSSDLSLSDFSSSPWYSHVEEESQSASRNISPHQDRADCKTNIHSSPHSFYFIIYQEQGPALAEKI